MATSITPAQAQAAFKKTYGDKFLKVSEVETMLQDAIGFDGERVGDEFVQALRATNEWGFSFRAAGSAAPQMNPAIALKVEKATITGNIIDFRSRIDVETMARAVTSVQSFKDHVGLRMESMRDSMKQLLEWVLLKGGAAVCTVASKSGSGVTRTVTFGNDFPAGFFAGSENMPFDIYSSAGSKRNTSSSTAKFTLTGYDLENKTLDLTADDANDWTNVAATDGLWLLGSYGTQASGLYTIVANQTATINNLNATTYPMFRGVKKSLSAAISMAALLKANAKCAQRGARKVNQRVLLSDNNFAVLNSDLAASRRYDGSYSRTKGANGFGAIEFHSPTGVLTVESHQYISDDYVLGLDMETFSRRGPSPITFEIPGAGGDYFLLVPDYQVFEYRGYSHQGLLCVKPARNFILDTVTPPT